MSQSYYPQRNQYCSLMTPDGRQFSNRSDESTDSSGFYQNGMIHSDTNSYSLVYERNSFSQPTQNPAVNQPSSTAYICLFPYCDKYFRRSFDLKRHMKTHFPSEEVFECEKGDFCGRYGPPKPHEKKGAFTRKDHFLQHRRDVHMEANPQGRGSGQVKRVKYRED